MKQSHRSTIISLFLVIIVDTLGVGMVSPIFSPMFAANNPGIMSNHVAVNIRVLLYGFTLTVFFIGMFFGSPLIGRLSDYIGRKKVLLICLGGSAACFLVSGLSILLNSVLLLIVSRFITGFLTGSLPIAQAAIMDVSENGSRALNLRFINIAYCVGFIFGPVISGIIIKYSFTEIRYALPFVLASMLAVINCMLLYISFKETAVNRLKEIRLMRLFIGNMTSTAKSLHPPKLRMLVITYFFFQVGWAIYSQGITIHLVHKFNYDSDAIGYFVAWMGTIFSLTLLVAMPYLLRVSSASSIAIFALLLSGLGMVLSATDSLSMYWLYALPVVFGVALSQTVLLTFFSEAVSDEMQGWVMGIGNAISAVTWGVGAAIVGLFSLHSFINMFVVSGVCLLVALLCYLYNLRQKVF